MIISLQNQKGGVGKTTLAIHLAHGLMMRGARVLLVDSDLQGSARDWAAARPNGDTPCIPVVGLDRPTIHRDLPRMMNGFDHVVIDGPPRTHDVARSGIMASDLVVVPVQPSPYDVWAAQETIDLLHEAVVYKELLKSVFAINRKIANTVIARDVLAALGEYEGVAVLATEIVQRVAYAETAATGSTVLETDPQGAAAKEIMALVDEILEGSE